MSTQVTTDPALIPASLPAKDTGGSSKILGRTRVKISPLVLVTIIAGGAIWWANFGKKRYLPKRFGVVVPGKIYRSGQNSKWLIEDLLVKHKIEGIIDFTGFDWNDEHQQAELAAAWKLKIAVNRFPQSGDGTGDIVKYANALRIMRDCEIANKPLLVHCAAGSQRTGAAVAYYRVLIQKKSPETALEEMRRYDCEPSENGRLIKYINENMGELANLLVEREVIDRVPKPLPQLVP